MISLDPTMTIRCTVTIICFPPRDNNRPRPCFIHASDHLHESMMHSSIGAHALKNASVRAFQSCWTLVITVTNSKPRSQPGSTIPQSILLSKNMIDHRKVENTHTPCL